MEVWIKEVGEYLYHNAVFIIAGVLLLGLCVAATPVRNPGWWLNFAPKGYRQGARKMRKERKRFVDGIVTGDFVDKVETRVHAGEITRDEATEVYRKLKQLFPIRDLFPSAEWLKKQINRRVGNHTTPKLVDKKKEEPRKRRNMLDPIPERVVL